VHRGLPFHRTHTQTPIGGMHRWLCPAPLCSAAPCPSSPSWEARTALFQMNSDSGREAGDSIIGAMAKGVYGSPVRPRCRIELRGRKKETSRPVPQEWTCQERYCPGTEFDATSLPPHVHIHLYLCIWSDSQVCSLISSSLGNGNTLDFGEDGTHREEAMAIFRAVLRNIPSFLHIENLDVPGHFPYNFI
jgi:hypothetical protein